MRGKPRQFDLTVAQDDVSVPDAERVRIRLKIDLDKQGRVSGAHLVQNTESHQIIEEFMLAANEAVADKLFAAGVPFMTGLWVYPSLFGVEIPLSTVMSFDIGVYLVVVGAITSIALALEERESD